MPSLPSPWEKAMLTYDWKKGTPLGLELNPDMTFAHPDGAKDEKLRLEMSRRLGVQNRRAWGYVLDIES